MGCRDINYAGDNEGKILGTFPKVGCGSATILEQWRRGVVGSKNDMNKAVADGNSMWQTLEVGGSREVVRHKTVEDVRRWMVKLGPEERAKFSAKEEEL
eukprot:g18628.t1